MSNLEHKLSNENQTEIRVGGKAVWVPAIPLPYFTTKGLPFWKRLNENNWYPECACGRTFKTMEDYEAHVVYKSSPYGGEL
jgi:hypothetical protein